MGAADGPRELAALILAATARTESARAEDPRRLPTERQLAVDLGVSRSAVRHAMAVLQAEGRISREVGRGTFLRDGNGTQDVPAADPADYSPADVMLVRRMFEPHAMSLVVAWATDRDFAEMDRCLRGGDASDEHDEFEVWDGALHRAIIAATHSPLLVRLYTEVERARHGKVWGDLKRRSASAARREEYKSDHAEIVTALRQRDADRASAAMRTHLARVSRHLLGTGDGLALLISCSGSGPSAARTPPRSRCQPPSARPTASAGQAARPYRPAVLAPQVRAALRAPAAVRAWPWLRPGLARPTGLAACAVPARARSWPRQPWRRFSICPP